MRAWLAYGEPRDSRSRLLYCNLVSTSLRKVRLFLASSFISGFRLHHLAPFNASNHRVIGAMDS